MKYFQRVELCTTNYKNILCLKMNPLSLVTAWITTQCTWVYAPVSSKTCHVLPGYTLGICLELCFEWIILSRNEQPVVEQLSDTLEIVVVFSRIWTLQFEDFKVVAVGQLHILKIANIPGQWTKMCPESEIRGGLTGGGEWLVWSWLGH